MVAFAKDRHFDRQLMSACLPIPRTFGIRDSFVSLREKTSTREGFPIKASHNKPRPGLSPHCQNNVAFSRFHVHGQRVISIRRNGLSHLHECLNSRNRSWITCTSGHLGLHQLSPHMDSSLAWLYSLISQNLHGGGMMRISSVRAHKGERPTLNSCALSRWLPPATNDLEATLLACFVCTFMRFALQ